jgi:uncharacterized membrane protein
VQFSLRTNNSQTLGAIVDDFLTLAARGGGFSQIIGWFIRVVIYDICITGISDTLHVPRMVALFIFLGILAVISFVLYIFKQKYAGDVED